MKKETLNITPSKKERLQVIILGVGGRDSLDRIRKNVHESNPRAEILEAPSVISLDHPERIRGKRVLVIEDGPTFTHGGMPYGAGASISMKVARELIDARPYAVGRVKEVYKKYPRIGSVLPAVGYSEEQMKDLGETIELSRAEGVVIATPIDLARKISIRIPWARVFYDFDIDLSPVINSLRETVWREGRAGDALRRGKSG